ncbi:polycystin-1-like [Panulirus ornatus]|uniref:polycystin-1-like n=1 Tax=Panulirus ornatus TaxID=150431 RepID=UPI003A892240
MVAVTALATGNCELSCDDASPCGSIDSSMLATFSTGGGSPAFTMTAINDNTGITLTLQPEAAGATFLVDLNYGAPPSYITTSNVIADPFLVPGFYEITVMSMIEGTPMTHSKFANLTQVMTPSVDRVGCPIVWEPDIIYYCNVSVTMADESDSFTAVFDDDSSQFVFTSIGSEIYRLGNPPPRELTRQVVAPSSSTGEIIMTQHRIRVPSMIIAFDIYATAAGAFTVSVRRPTCASGQYSVDVQGCVTTSPDDIFGTIHTCESDQVFCPRKPTCSDGTLSCLLPEGTATWADVPDTVVTSTFSGEGFHRENLPGPVELLPGDVIAIVGPIGRSPEQREGGDTVDGIDTLFHHYVVAIIKQEMPVQVSHICTTVNLDVSLEVTDDDLVATPLKNHTSCERIITDVAVKVTQTVTDIYDSSVNVDSPFYIRSQQLANFTVMFSVAGPVYFTFSYEPSFGINHTFIETGISSYRKIALLNLNEGRERQTVQGDYPKGTIDHELTYSIQLDIPDMYLVTVSAENQHNVDPGPISNFTILYVQHEVSTSWIIKPDDPVGFFIPTETPSFRFVDGSLGNFPTNASAHMDWGDGTDIEVLPFEDPGNKEPVLMHTYAKGGIYNVSAFISNFVSGYEVSCEVLIVEKIHDFTIVNKYFPTLTSTEARNGFGKLKNQYPLDKNLSFFPEMTNGTVELYTVIHTNNMSEILTFQVADPFLPKANPFHYHFDFVSFILFYFNSCLQIHFSSTERKLKHTHTETFLNLTVIAMNIFENVTVDLFLEIVGEVRLCQIEDFSEVTEKEETKTFLISFESLGGGTCLLVDWDDTDPIVSEAYGEKTTCQSGYVDAIYHDLPLLDVSVNLTHTYSDEGKYNVTILAFNDLSDCLDSVMTFVTNLKCKPPIVSIIDGTIDHLAPVQFFRSGKINSLDTDASINCELTTKTKKRWQLYYTVSATEIIWYPLHTMHVFESWNRSELILPELSLEYGLFMGVYTLTMYDPEKLDPSWPFHKQLHTIFEIVKTPLIAVLLEAAVSKVVRGLDQEVEFEPYKYSIDPDFPEEKNFSVVWKCRNINEDWPVPGVDSSKPVWQKGTGGGCFGHGPGLLDHSGHELILKGNNFINVNEVYEVRVTISKDTRTKDVIGQVKVVDYVPPLVHIACVEWSLCFPREDGVYINPSNRIGIIGACIDHCLDSQQYLWQVADSDGNVYPSNQIHFPLGIEEMEFAISTQFFDDNPEVTAVDASLTVTNSDGDIGAAWYFMKVNQRPINGYCDITSPETRRALVDMFYLTCDSWHDPENQGISHYLVTLIGEDEETIPILESKHRSSPPQVEPLILPPGTFTIRVQVTDVWDAFTIVDAAPGLEVLMPSKEEIDAADIQLQIGRYEGAGNADMLNMIALANCKVVQEASWLALDEEGITKEELESRLKARAAVYNQMADAIIDNVNFNTIGSINIAAGILASVVNEASANDIAIRSIDIPFRDKVSDIFKDINDTIKKMDLSTPEHLSQLFPYLVGITNGIGMSLDKSGNRQDGQCVVPPSDTENSGTMDYDTEVKGVDMKIERNEEDRYQCNVLDLTKGSAPRIVESLYTTMTTVKDKMMKLYVVGESHNFTTSNGVHIRIGMLTRDDLHKLDIGIIGGSASLQQKFCPVENCTLSSPMGFSFIEWSANIFSFAKGVDKLSPETKVLDLSLYNRDMIELVIEDLPPEEWITLDIPRSFSGAGNTTPPAMEIVNATEKSSQQSIPVLYSTFNVTLPDPNINIEIILVTPNPRIFLFLDKPRLPTLQDSMIFYMVNNIPVDNGTHMLFLPSKDLQGPGRYFIGVGEFKDTSYISRMDNPKENNVTMDAVQNITTDYGLRIIVSGAAFLNKTTMEWDTKGIVVTETAYAITKCESDHLTSFGSGMFVMPNTIDFNYVFANMGFSDNLTIYLTLIISFAIFIILLIWARSKDRKDSEKVGAAPLPDNKVEDKYLYEILVFTGNTKGAQTDSLVQFIVSGEDDETDIRTLGDDKRKILRKADVDVFVMAVPRPLGPLQFLRIWHDNSGKGPNASWYLSYIVLRDVQTGDKYEFICNQWFGVEFDDGQIDRLLPVAGNEQKEAFKHLFKNTANKNIADGHLWFSVFLRPPRSRFTRCQRVASCFALLFLSMLVNAMWYERVPEQPGSSGLQFGPFSLSPEQIGVGVVSNLIVFPPSFLIVLLFRKSRPRNLRKSRIEQAVEQTRLSKQSESARSTLSMPPVQHPPNSSPKKIIEKKQIKKKFTLPWWCSLIAWVLVVICIVASCFFLLMYGIMFGNSKATKWVTSLIISFFSSVLFIQPLKIFLMAMLMSAIFKSSNLDEDDVDEDEEDPKLEQDQSWLHAGTRHNRTLQHHRVDEETLKKLREARLKEKKMWAVMKEIFAYTFFLWIFLILSYGNRDPNAYYLQMNLKNSFIHEGALDGTDFTKVTDTSRLWYYLYNGLLSDLRAQRHYNGKSPYGLRGFLNDQCNRILGYATIRQIRIKEKTCRVPSLLRTISRECNGFTSIINEDSRDYCVEWTLPTNQTINTASCRIPEFRYSSAVELKSLPVWGERDWYGGGGYVIHLRDKTENIMKKFHELQRNHWIDHKTRAVILEFSSYNSQVFDGIRLLQHHDNFGTFIICCEVLFIIFVVYFTIREVVFFYKQRLKYFDNYWSYAEIAILLASYSAIVVYIFRYLATDEVLKEFDRTHGNGYVKLQFAAFLDELYGYIVGFIVFVGTLKFIKLLRFIKRLGVLSATLHQCWDDLSGFLMAFFLCFFSFVAMFYLLLNIHLGGFYNFITAVETCFGMMLGKFQFEEMKQVSLMVPFMFFIFVLCNSWVLINLLLTLIIKSFTQVKHDIMKQPNEYEMVAFVWGRFQAFLGMRGPTHVSPIINTTSEMTSKDSQDNCVEDFPDKVDKFLDYVNAAYFSGSLDVNSKDALKSSMYQKSTTH